MSLSYWIFLFRKSLQDHVAHGENLGISGSVRQVKWSANGKELMCLTRDHLASFKIDSSVQPMGLKFTNEVTTPIGCTYHPKDSRTAGAAWANGYVRFYIHPDKGSEHDAGPSHYGMSVMRATGSFRIQGMNPFLRSVPLSSRKNQISRCFPRLA